MHKLENNATDVTYLFLTSVFTTKINEDRAISTSIVSSYVAPV